MSSLVVIGAQWGDEGKGKLVDYLTSRVDIVSRFQGGNNAGHTLKVDGQTTKLALVPSGILHKSTLCCIGAGVVLDPKVFRSELQSLIDAGISVGPERIIVDRDAHLILPYHCAVDIAREKRLGDKKIGTTGRGIGPCYEDRAARCGVRIAELTQLELLRERLEPLVEEKNRYLEAVLGESERVAFETVWEAVQIAAETVLPLMGNVSLLIHNARLAEKRIVFEGAQGTLLDQMHGTIPFVTSSNTIAGAVTTGCGVGPQAIDHVLGVAKAYCTRVGSGPFPTELLDAQGDLLREKGREFGTITGRPRRCGWFDAVAMKRAVRLNGIDSLAITKLDVLSGMKKISIAINYHLDGEKLEDAPSLVSELERVKPEFIELDGWDEDIEGARKWHHLPKAARFYLSTISEIIGCPIGLVSVGPDRESTLYSSSGTFVRNFMGEPLEQER